VDTIANQSSLMIIECSLKVANRLVICATVLQKCCGWAPEVACSFDPGPKLSLYFLQGAEAGKVHGVSGGPIPFRADQRCHLLWGCQALCYAHVLPHAIYRLLPGSQEHDQTAAEGINNGLKQSAASLQQITSIRRFLMRVATILDTLFERSKHAVFIDRSTASNWLRDSIIERRS
jgi:hypothetical protein